MSISNYNFFKNNHNTLITYKQINQKIQKKNYGIHDIQYLWLVKIKSYFHK